jgi:LacI family transcriptional regulator, gluconate utilization system Gnt-I transcriptional repressor
LTAVSKIDILMLAFSKGRFAISDSRKGESSKTDKTPKSPIPKGSEGSRRSTGAVTLSDVAKVSGVSPITVSRVLNHPELVSPRTLDVVQRGIDRTGYVPNLVAGGLVSSRSHYVAAVVPDISSRFSESIQSLTEKLSENGYQVILATSMYSASREESLLMALLGRRPEGMFLTGISHTDQTRRRLAIAKIPVVETGDLTPTPIDVVIGFSQEKAGEAIAEYLVNLGYKSFGVISTTEARSEKRRTAFMSVLAKKDLSDVVTVQMEGPAGFQKGREALSRLLELGKLPRAVYCSTDMLAQGALAEAQARRIPVPDDLALMGFWDFDFAAHTFPALSTVHIDLATLGRLAAEALLARFEGKRVDTVMDIGFQIIQRGTTRHC